MTKLVQNLNLSFLILFQYNQSNLQISVLSLSIKNFTLIILGIKCFFNLNVKTKEAGVQNLAFIVRLFFFKEKPSKSHGRQHNH